MWAVLNLHDLKCNGGLTLLMGFDQMHELGKLLILKNGKKLRGCGELHCNHRTHITMGDKRRHQIRQFAKCEQICLHTSKLLDRNNTESIT